MQRAAGLAPDCAMAGPKRREGVKMADSKTAQEPSMEEILSSIRRIIAEDDAVAGPSAAASGAGDASPDDDDDDVLELTEVVDRPERPPEPAFMAPSPLASIPQPPARPEPSIASPESAPMSTNAAEALISPVTASASTQALARLTKAAASDERKMPATAGGLTIEQLLVDLLTPMLRDWLDTNLPGIVERVVEQEVKKLARRAELM
jgi:cell pole-organizing protein PopZ